MSALPATGRPGRVRLAAAAAGALLLAGCGAGQVASTTLQVAAVNGGSGTSSTTQLEVDNVEMAFPEAETARWDEGADVPLTFTISNQDAQPDTLTGVSSPAASSVEVEGTTEIPARSAVVGVDDESTVADAETAAGTQNSNSETGASNAGQVRVVLTGLTAPITSGQTADVTFSFANAGDITVPVPVAAPTQERTEDSHNGEHSES